MNMDKSERIYIAPKRGRLPRRYEVIDQWPVTKKLRWLSVFLIVGAAFWFGVWWVSR